jgi:hypothetical protein
MYFFAIIIEDLFQINQNQTIFLAYSTVVHQAVDVQINLIIFFK